MAVPSYPDYFVTGPVHHFIRIRQAGLATGFATANIPGGAIYYLGTAEVTPQLQVYHYKQKVPNDEAGKTLPGQETRDGYSAKVAVVLTRLSRVAYNQLLVRGTNAGLDFAAGQETRWSRGALVKGQLDFELWQVYENYLNPVNNQGIEPGRYWPSVDWEEDSQPAAGTQVERKLFVFDCQPKRLGQASYSSINAATNERGWMLFRMDTNAFPADVAVPQ